VTAHGVLVASLSRRMVIASAYVTSSTRTPSTSTTRPILRGRQPLECPPVATLVTGLGYIGVALAQRLRAQRPGEKVVGLDNFFSTDRAAIPSDVELVEGDVADPAAVSRALAATAPGDEPLTVIHLAAQPSAAVAARDPATTERSNLIGARVVLEAARDRHARVIFGGSFRVYGDDLSGCVDEDTPYGRVGDLSHLSKIYVEQLGRMLGGAFCSVRLGVVYGLAPVMKSTDPAFMTVPNLFCQRAVRGEALQVLEDRPLAFIHVDDAVDALLAARDRQAGSAETWEVVNAAPEVVSIGELARIVQDIAQQHGRWVPVVGAGHAQHAPRFEVRSRLPFQPRHTLRDSLGEVFEYFLRA
jgi:UDP-glucose 4-epimerase